MSIIVPAYNEEHGLGGVLTELSAIQEKMGAAGQTVEMSGSGR